MTDNRMTAELDAIRLRVGSVREGGVLLTDMVAKDDAPRLQAAVDAVLKNHQPGRIAIFGYLCKRHENHRYFSITATEAADVEACQDCTATIHVSCTGCAGVSVDQCPDRNGIAAALLGKAET